MRGPDPVQTASDRAHDQSARSDDDVYAAIHCDDAAMRANHLERARKLGRRLRVEVAIDDTGWLRSAIEIVFSKEQDGTLRPVMVRVGAEAKDGAILERGGVIASCAQYNDSLHRLRQLAERLTDLVRQDRVHLDSGSPVAYAHRELSRLDELIARRQRITMAHGVVRLGTLHREIEFFMRCDAHLAPIVLAAERATSVSSARDRPRARKRWRWPRWWPVRRTATHRPHGTPEASPRSTT